MNYRILYVFVEGPDDERFSNRIIKLYFSDYQIIKTISYSEEKPVTIAKLLRTISQRTDRNFLFFHDYDDHPCITSCKQKICEKYSHALRPEDIIVVKKEIESWYLAGIPEENCERFNIKLIRDTENVSKEQFNQMIPSGFVRTDFMVELLKDYSLDVAEKHNSSFAYFLKKHIQES